MYRNRRCYDRPYSFNNETSFAYTNEGMGASMNPNEYPKAGMSGMNADMQNCQMGPMPSCQIPPVYECPQERVCHKEFIHEVPQD